MQFNKQLKILIITLSDRAAAGEYEDKSGELARQMLNGFLPQRDWEIAVEKIIIPDESVLLKQALIQGISIKQNDIIFTLGSTGLDSRDIAPEVVLEVSDKQIPGIMEFVRTKYGKDIPNALLSRSVATIACKTLIFSLPGSVKAVAEYLTEIFNVLEHAIYMLHDLRH